MLKGNTRCWQWTLWLSNFTIWHVKSTLT